MAQLIAEKTKVEDELTAVRAAAEDKERRHSEILIKNETAFKTREKELIEKRTKAEDDLRQVEMQRDDKEARNKALISEHEQWRINQETEEKKRTMELEKKT
jgi:hypothetical protein